MATFNENFIESLRKLAQNSRQPNKDAAATDEFLRELKERQDSYRKKRQAAEKDIKRGGRLTEHKIDL